MSSRWERKYFYLIQINRQIIEHNILFKNLQFGNKIIFKVCEYEQVISLQKHNNIQKWIHRNSACTFISRHIINWLFDLWMAKASSIELDQIYITVWSVNVPFRGSCWSCHRMRASNQGLVRKWRVQGYPLRIMVRDCGNIPQFYQ